MHLTFADRNLQARQMRKPYDHRMWIAALRNLPRRVSLLRIKNPYPFANHASPLVCTLISLGLTPENMRYAPDFLRWQRPTCIWRPHRKTSYYEKPAPRLRSELVLVLKFEKISRPNNPGSRQD